MHFNVFPEEDLNSYWMKFLYYVRRDFRKRHFVIENFETRSTTVFPYVTLNVLTSRAVQELVVI